jgi:hypothetical protein
MINIAQPAFVTFTHIPQLIIAPKGHQCSIPLETRQSFGLMPAELTGYSFRATTGEFLPAKGANAGITRTWFARICNQCISLIRLTSGIWIHLRQNLAKPCKTFFGT